MPNWNSGTLKIRGQKDNVVSALKEFAPFIDVDVDDEMGIISLFSNENKHIFYGVRRAYCQQQVADEVYFDSDEEVLIVFSCVEVAWALLPEHGWLDVSKKHQIDFRWHGFECGMQFEQDIEICKGELIKNTEITYDDYKWDCPFPNHGG